MFACILFAALQTQGGTVYPPLPARAFTPRLIDPGLDGNTFRWFLGGEFTPDGKLLIAYRNPLDPFDPSYPAATFDNTLYRGALVATVVHPERMLTNEHGHLTGFYQPNPGDWPFGHTFTFGAPQDPIVGAEPVQSKMIHHGWPLKPATSGEPGYMSACRPPDTTPVEFANGFKVDYPDFPLPLTFAFAHMTLALMPLPVGNPYPSDVDGTYAMDGAFQTYKIWLVRTHSSGLIINQSNQVDLAKVVCKPDGGELVTVTTEYLDPVFVAQRLTVILGPDSNIAGVSVEKPFETLLTSGGQKIHGIEPSMTEDGCLIVFHGNGANPVFAPGDANVTYIFNVNPCSPTGWTPPRSITQLPSELTGAALEAFKDRYRIFKQPIRMPPNNAGNQTAGVTHAPLTTVRGTYPWISKDGSFFIASSAEALESNESPSDAAHCAPSTRNRVGGYACGDITGGYIKYIDDVGINPTRLGGAWDWPSYSDLDGPCMPPNPYRNSWRTSTFSTGIKPGPWEPFLGEGHPLPTHVASERIPVLPVFSLETDTYGEVRFEEADGNYLLYLACNESLAVQPTSLTNPGEAASIFDVHSTPDTSGRATRALCTLNDGAAFPQEVLDDSELLRHEIGYQLNGGHPLHENVGFKGQGIVFNLDGQIDVSAAPALSGMKQFTVQAFVKVVGNHTGTRTLFEYGGNSGGTRDPVVTLKLNGQKRFVATASIKVGAARQSLQATSRMNAVAVNQNLYQPDAGWRHVAITYDGTALGKSRLRIHVDSVIDQEVVNTATSEVWNPSGTDYYLVGPGRVADPDEVDDSNKLYVLDEIAVSDIRRTTSELRRDAYVVPEPDEFVPWPDDLQTPDLPFDLDREEVEWPEGLVYRQEVVDLGRDLFDSGALSHPDNVPLRKCTTCHLPSRHFTGAIGDVLAKDVNNQDLPFNTPTLRNAAFGLTKFFDGRAASIEEQVLQPILLGPEMGGPNPGGTPIAQDIQTVLGRVNAEFGTDFTTVFGAIATEETLVEALAMYLRSLNTAESEFDYQSFDDVEEAFGQALFFGKANCFHCHRGTNFSDDDFHNVLTMDMSAPGADMGRYDATGRDLDKGRLKTPTLRNLLLTGPYFHDGSKTSLEAVVDHYNLPPFDLTNRGVPDRHLRPLFLTPTEKQRLVKFLKSLLSP